MGTTKTVKQGLLANAFSSSKWDSRIKSANTTRKEMWLGYVLGVWGMMMTSSVVNSYYNQYLTDVIGFDSTKGAWIATFMVLFPLLSKIIDAVTNLVMAKIIDSTTCRQGKVRPWLLISTPFIVITVILLFWIPFTQPVHQAIWIVIAFNLYYSVSYTMWNMSKELSPAVATRNVNQRKNLSMAAQIVGSAGTGVVSILFPTILAAVCRAVNGDNAKGYLLCMSIVAILAACTTFIQYFYTREHVTEERRNQLVVSAMMMFAVGIAQGLFNLGLMVTGYTQPQQIGTSAEGVALYADQAAAATGWINFSYQGTFIIVGVVVFFMFCFVFKIENDMPKISKELQERRVAECAAKGIEYIPADELERREREEADLMAEEIRIRELKERCARQGLDFDKENQKALDKRAAKAAKAARRTKK